jgi:hypothetical protein
MISNGNPCFVLTLTGQPHMNPDGSLYRYQTMQQSQLSQSGQSAVPSSPQPVMGSHSPGQQVLGAGGQSQPAPMYGGSPQQHTATYSSYQHSQVFIQNIIMFLLIVFLYL